MIGKLPESLEIKGKEFDIRYDYLTILLIFQAYNDPEMTQFEKTLTMLECIYLDFNNLKSDDYEEAIEKAIWFIDSGSVQSSVDSNGSQPKKIMDWEQDEQLIFASINKVAGYEVRNKENLHWWTFLGYYNEIGEGLFSTVVGIRQKKAKRKKLEKYEQEFYGENKHLIDFNVKYSKEEQEEIDYWNKILG